MREEPSDEFVLIDDINGSIFTMEQNPKSQEIIIYKINKGKLHVTWWLFLKVLKLLEVVLSVYKINVNP